MHSQRLRRWTPTRKTPPASPAWRDRNRTTFDLPAAVRAKKAQILRFTGIDYKAHVFINGIFLGSHEGFFAPIEFDLAAAITSVEAQVIFNDTFTSGNRTDAGYYITNTSNGSAASVGMQVLEAVPSIGRRARQRVLPAHYGKTLLPTTSVRRQMEPFFDLISQ